MRQPDLTLTPPDTAFGLEVLKPTDIWVLASNEVTPDDCGEHTDDSGIRIAFRPHQETDIEEPMRSDVH